jgi:hypothetical protein
LLNAPNAGQDEGIGRGNRPELANVREFYYARDAMNELVSKVIARKKKLICGMKTFQTDVTCKIIVSNMLMFKQEFN